MKIKYVTYNLNKIKFFNAALHLHHVGLVFEIDENNYYELHYGVKKNSITECHNKHLRKGRRDTYAILEKEMKYEEAKDLIIKEFHNKEYNFGNRDCWSLVEWFCKQIGVDKADLKGPIGARKQHGNGVRHITKQAKSNLIDIVTGIPITKLTKSLQ